MSLINCPGTMDDLQTELNISDDDVRLEIAGNASARQIEGYLGYGLWAEDTVSTRTFYPESAYCVKIPQGISTDVGLIVQTDTAGDGTFATTLTLGTNFILLPTNALLEAQPYTEIRSVDGSSFFPSWQTGRPGVQITAKFGWPDAGDDVKKAWLIQSVQLYKASDAVFGAIQLGEGGFATRVGRGLNPMAEALLQKYCRPVVA